MRDATVVTTWNAIAARTIVTEAATPIPSSSLSFAFVALAVHDAVTAVEGRYEPYLGHPGRRVRHASAEAAAATAAYRVLRHDFPASATRLDADYTTSLGAVPAGRARLRGIRAGALAAARVIRDRRDDGRGETVTVDVVPATGVWRPTSPEGTPMLVPWLGFVDPLLLRSPTQLRLPGPDPVTSAAYARDYAEVKAYGGLTGSSRTATQTVTALFWNVNSVLQYQVAMRDQVTRRGLGLSEAARAFALLSSSTADALITCWRAKLDDGFWRPVTAIHLADEDGNRATEPDPAWQPLVATPPYPEYPSGHACITGAASGTFGHLFGADSLDLDVPSFTTAPARHFDTAAALDGETLDARIWLGLPFRRAMTDANALGHRVSDVAHARFFRPLR